MKFIVVTGGVISGLGKGITASSIGLLFKSLGFRVTAIKIDPYLNSDSGLMSPFEHGECYVLHDSGETDLDLGNYERFLNINLTRDHNITTGKIYTNVITKERNGDYLGKTVQVVPHIVDEIQDWILMTAQVDVGEGEPDICVIELGGTIGDIETAPFIEALTRLSQTVGKENICFVHVSLIIEIGGEHKTKPTQQSIRTLRSLGINPDLLVLRTKSTLDDDAIGKIHASCGINKDRIICNLDVPNIYYVPDLFKKQDICNKISKTIGLEIDKDYELDYYYNILDQFNRTDLPIIKIGIAGKYVGSQDTYLSLIRAIEHASFKVGCRAHIVWIDTEKIEDDNESEWIKLNGCNRVIIPGGFGKRGIDGKIMVCKFCRTNGVKMLGICLGMQIMVVEYARTIGYHDAVSTEWSNYGFGIIDILPDQTGKLGGTMRLGNYEAVIIDDSVKSIYGSDVVTERHRHRYELSYDVGRETFKDTDLVLSAIDRTSKYVEMVRINGHPYFIGCQFHPEFISRYDKPHPLFVNLLKN